MTIRIRRAALIVAMMTGCAIDAPEDVAPGGTDDPAAQPAEDQAADAMLNGSEHFARAAARPDPWHAQQPEFRGSCVDCHGKGE